MTKDELQKKKETLRNDIERLKKVIDSCSGTTFEIIIEDLKEQMQESVKIEKWSEVKSLIKEVDSVNNTKLFIQKQVELLDKKEYELEEVIEQIDNYQTNIFEQNKKD